MKTGAVEYEPTHQEIIDFIKENPKSTICQLREHFKQSGESGAHIMKDGKKFFWCYGCKKSFIYLLEKVRFDDNIIQDVDTSTCLISDSTSMKLERGEDFLPLVLTYVG
jgi:hypothetical protein